MSIPSSDLPQRFLEPIAAICRGAGVTPETFWQNRTAHSRSSVALSGVIAMLLREGYKSKQIARWLRVSVATVFYWRQHERMIQQQRTWRKSRYDRLKAAGKCVSCGKADAPKRSVKCLACRGLAEEPQVVLKPRRVLRWHKGIAKQAQMEIEAAKFETERGSMGRKILNRMCEHLAGNHSGPSSVEELEQRLAGIGQITERSAA